jgi:hypothetical protein
MLIDSITKYDTFAKIDKSNLKKSNALQPGDILVKKVFDVLKGTAIEGMIVAGQKLFAKGTGSATSEHFAMMLTSTDLIESDEDGVVCNKITGGDLAKTRYIVYRCRNSKIRDQAVLFGYQFMGYKRADALPGKIKPGKYSWKAGFASLRAEPLVNKSNDVKNNTLVYDFMQFCDGKSSTRPDFFCSMFVAVCYEAAAARLQDAHYFLGLNAHGATPKAYEGILLANADKFTFAGVYGDPFEK